MFIIKTNENLELSWGYTEIGGMSTSIYSLKINPLNRNVIYFSADSKFYRSSNSGGSFIMLNPIIAREIAVNSLDTNLLICNSNGIYKSTNGGINFVQTLNINTNKFLIHPESPNIVYSGTDQGIYRSTNFGSSWVLYFASFSGSQNVTGLAKYMNDLDTIYASNNSYVIKIWASSVGIKPISNEIPASFKLEQNYPNPFNPITNIKFHFPLAGFAELKIYNSLGNEIQTLLSEELKPGIYNIEWDGNNQPSGVYFYTLRAGDFKETKKLVLVK
jgi:hypothetical protein